MALNTHVGPPSLCETSQPPQLPILASLQTSPRDGPECKPANAAHAARQLRLSIVVREHVQIIRAQASFDTNRGKFGRIALSHLLRGCVRSSLVLWVSLGLVAACLQASVSASERHVTCRPKPFWLRLAQACAGGERTSAHAAASAASLLFSPAGYTPWRSVQRALMRLC